MVISLFKKKLIFVKTKGGLNLHFCITEAVINCIFVHVLEKKNNENTRFSSVINIKFSDLRFLSTSTKIVLECFITLRPESSYVKKMYMLYYFCRFNFTNSNLNHAEFDKMKADKIPDVVSCIL